MIIKALSNGAWALRPENEPEEAALNDYGSQGVTAPSMAQPLISAFIRGYKAGYAKAIADSTRPTTSQPQIT